MNKYTRRKFLKDLFSDVFNIYDEVRGNDNIPLDKIILLPDETIKSIRVIFFKECKHKIVDKTLHKKALSDTEWKSVINLTDIDLFVFISLKKKLKISEITTACQDKFELKENIAYLQVKKIFLLLITNRICHPDKKFNYDEIEKEK